MSIWVAPRVNFTRPKGFMLDPWDDFLRFEEMQNYRTMEVFVCT